MAVTEAAGAQAAEHHHAAPGHEGHEMPPAESGGVPHDLCRDLAHCAAAVLPVTEESTSGEVAVPVARAAGPLTAPLSVEHSLEPPPPKR